MRCPLVRHCTCVISIELLCSSVSPAECKPLYVNFVKTMRQELSATVAVKKREGQMDELYEGSQEVRGQLGKG